MVTMISKLYRLKYIDSREKIGWSSFAPLARILYRLDQLLEEGMYCIVIDENGDEYKAPIPTAKPIAAPKYPSPKPMMLDAIATHLKKPENVERRKKAKLNDDAMWARLRA